MKKKKANPKDQQASSNETSGQNPMQVNENQALYIAGSGEDQIVLEKLPTLPEFLKKMRKKYGHIKRLSEKEEREAIDQAFIEDYYKNLKNEDGIN